MKPSPPRHSVTIAARLPPPDPAHHEKVAADLRELRAVADADLRAVPPWLPLAQLHPRGPHTPCPPPPAAKNHRSAAMARRARSLPAQREGQRLLEELGAPPPPQPLSPPALITSTAPPCAFAMALDLHRLTWRVASDGHQLPPLLAALTRRPKDDTRLRQLRAQLRVHETQQRGAPTTPPVLGFSLLQRPKLEESAVTLRVQPPLCPEPTEDALEAEVLPGREVRELYRQLGTALPSERLRFDQEPLVEPAAAAANLVPEGQQGTRAAPRRTPTAGRQKPENATLLQDYLRYLSDTSSDFLHTIFNLGGGSGGEEEEEKPVEALWETAEPGLPAAATGTVTPVVTEQLQRRLHQLWAALRVPGRERLAMATKYGCGTALARLPAALEAWEAAAGLIQQREQLLAWLEGLEVRASDPNRFFCRDPKSFLARAGEARARGRLRAAMVRCEGPLRAALRRLREEFGDTVTLRGRPYEEKMCWDVVEMLYRLQQGRRAGALGAMLQPAGAEMLAGGTGRL